jgi:rhodanese-related sulfurtransferase
MALSRRTLLGLTIAGTVALAGCSSSAGLPQGTVVIDVRTPAEYASGHLEGATNIDIEASTFSSKIAKLDKNTPYFIYCHSGNRAGQAITAMKAVGFANLTNGGGITAAAQTSGLKIVT